VTSERDWVDVLERAAVIAPAGFDDPNGNPVYRLLGFPPGEEGERLRALFARHVRTGSRSASRIGGSPRLPERKRPSFRGSVHQVDAGLKGKIKRLA
jgi:hypothetical protein